MYSYKKGDFETMTKDLLRPAKEKYFNGHLDARSVQENFNQSRLITLLPPLTPAG